MGKIYTRTGDTGEAATLLWGRRSKADEVFEVIGTLDELNCFLGLAASAAARELLEPVQNDVFDIGYAVMSAGEFDASGTRAARLEREIDRIEQLNRPLQRFILPGGTTPAATVHCARAVCRRAERVLVRYEAPAAVLRYINRLSDFLFVLARQLNGAEERYWERTEARSTETTQ